jgi:uncharacterized membrane protein YraQ (UPF0718 family)
LFQALLAGSLLHVVLRHPPTATGEEPARTWHAASVLGGLAAAALVFGLGELHVHAEQSGGGVGAGFLELALESAPAVLFAYLAVGIMHALPMDLFRILRRGSPWGQALRGTLVGLPISVCSCGVIPLYRSLVVSGVPTTAAMAFLVATPELEITAVILSLSLLGTGITVARLAAAFVLALLVGRVVGALARSVPQSAVPLPAARQPLRSASPPGCATALETWSTARGRGSSSGSPWPRPSSLSSIRRPSPRCRRRWRSRSSRCLGCRSTSARRAPRRSSPCCSRRASHPARRSPSS